jgi:lysophospholipase L1-like esterase
MSDQPVVADECYWQSQQEELAAILEKSEIAHVYCIGDCLTSGVPFEKIEGLPYPSQLQNILGNRYNVINLGRTMLYMKTLLSFINLFQKKITVPYSFVCVWCGTNDLYENVVLGDVYKWYTTFCAMFHTQHRVLAINMLPRTNMAPLDFETNRLAFNQLLRENYHQFADGLVDIGSNEKIGKFGCEYNAEYYVGANNTHLNANGYGVVAQLVADEIKKLQT